MPNKIITQVPVTALEIDSLQITPDTDLGPGHVRVLVGYHVLDNAGRQIGLGRSVHIVLTAQQNTTLVNFIQTNVVPAMNAQEGT